MEDISARIYSRLKYAKSRGTAARLPPEMVEYILNNISSFLDKDLVAREAKKAKREADKIARERKARQVKRNKEIRKQIKLPRHQVITAPKAKQIYEDRKAGMKYYEIAIKHSVSITTAQKFGNPFIKKKMMQKEKDRYARRRLDPEWVAKHREYVKKYSAKRREKEQNASV
jgi:hypothetical protein